MPKPPAPHTETITIRKRLSWLAALNVEITCDPATPPSIKLGLAARAAYSTGADLTDAVLTGAVLTGAVLRGEKIERVFAIAGRLDGYTFYGVQLRTGAVKIAAGCRWFTPDEYRAHVADDYPDTDKARETLDIIAFIERQAEGLPPPVAEIAAPAEALSGVSQ